MLISCSECHLRLKLLLDLRNLMLKWTNFVGPILYRQLRFMNIFALLPGFRLSPVTIFPPLSLSPCSYEFEWSPSAFRLFVSFNFSFSFVPFDSVPCESCKKSSFILPFRRPAPALVEPKSTWSNGHKGFSSSDEASDLSVSFGCLFSLAGELFCR